MRQFEEDWQGPDRAYSAAWYCDFRQVGHALVVMGDLDEFLRDPRWLALPIGKRIVGQRRLEVMLEYEQHERPGEPEVQMAARNMGLTTSRFYALLARWREERSVFSLVPYASAPSKINPDLSSRLHELLKEIGPGHRGEPVSALIDRVKGNWPGDLERPSDITLRRYIVRALNDMSELGGLRTNNFADFQEADKAATRYGEVVVIDHNGLDAFVVEDGEAGTEAPGKGVLRAPLVTLALDLYSRTVLGYVISYTSPGPQHVIEALRDVEARSAKAAEPGAEVLKPRLVFAVSRRLEWRPLLERVMASGIAADVRRTVRLHYGGPSRRIVGETFGLIPFARNKGHSLGEAIRQFDPDRSRLVSEAELRRILDQGMRDLAERRIALGTPIPRLRFDLGEDPAP